jgi:choline monooxygenase
MPFAPDPDVTRAETPPGSFYGDEEFARQRRDLFPRVWHFAPLPRRGLAPGHAEPWTLLPGCIDEPLVWTADERGTLRCLSNVCTHRGRVLVEHAGPQQHLRCGYHGRVFDLAGRLRAAPGFEGARDFPRPSDHLAEAPSGEWAGLRFLSLAPAMSFAEWLGPVRELLAWWSERALPEAPASVRDYEIDAHWALYVENYLEGMHIPYVHPRLARALALSDYVYEDLPWGTLQIGVGKASEGALPLPPGHPHARLRVAAYYVWLFPGTMLNFYPFGLSLNAIEPIGARRTRIKYVTYVIDPGRLGEGAGADVDEVEREDQAAVLATQRGIGARLYPRGRYAPIHERGVHRFHALLHRVRSGPGNGAPRTEY